MSDDAEQSRVGLRIGPYLLTRLLGRGGMGEVYAAEDTVRGRIVALKLMAPAFSNDPVFRKRLQREARSAGKLHEPHVVPIHDFGEIDGQLFVDMRLIDGTDLATLLRRDGPMPPARAVAIVRQIASALDAAHGEGVMHRDVKPANILVTSDDFACLVDFGIAVAAKDEKLTRLGDVLGTYAYMSPERLTGDEDKITHRADIYALACVLYEALTGVTPYQGNAATVMAAHLMEPVPQASALRAGIPRALDDVIAKGMAKEPDARQLTAGDFAMAAHRALATTDQDRASDILSRTQTVTLRELPTAGMAGQRTPTPPPASNVQPGWFGPTPNRPPPPNPYGYGATPPAPPHHPAGQPWQAGPPSGPPGQPSWAPQPQQPTPPGSVGAKSKSSSKLIAGVVGAVVVVVAVVAGFVVFWPEPTPPPPPAPTGIRLEARSDGVEVGNADAAAVVDVYDEPLCPPCGELISSSSDDIITAVTDGKIAVRYHLLNFLDDRSASRDYSSRAIAASLCVADVKDGKLYMEYYHGLFKPGFQPKEDGLTDRNDSDLAGLADDVGAPPEVHKCIDGGDKRGDVDATVSEAADQLNSLNGGTTPAVYEGSTKVNTSSHNWVDHLG